MTTGRVDRRDFLALSAASVAGSQVLQTPSALGEIERPSRVEIVDTLLYLGRWPFRPTPGNSAAKTIATLRQHGVAQAWAGTFEGVLHKDVSGANARLAEECRRDGEGMLIPFGVVNPTLPDWEEDVRRCHEAFEMPGIRLHPNYHGYTLTDERFAKLLALATKRKLIVQLVAQLDDERHAYPRMPAAPVDLSPLAAVVQRFPELRLTLHNGPGRLGAGQLGALPTAANVYFNVTAVDDLIAIPADRLALGSCWPLGTISDAIRRVRETFVLAADADLVLRDTAEALLHR